MIPHDAERRQSLGQLHVWSLLGFQSGGWNDRDAQCNLTPDKFDLEGRLRKWYKFENYAEVAPLRMVLLMIRKEGWNSMEF